MSKKPQDLGEGTLELHHFQGQFHHCVVIHSEPCVVDDDSGPTIDLFVDCDRREVEVFPQTLHLFQQQHHPEASIDEVCHLISQEVPVQVC